MKIGVIQATSQAKKNKLLYHCTANSVEKHGYEVINFGCYEDESCYFSYIEIAVMISMLLSSKVFDIYTGTGIEENKKSIAYSLEFGVQDRTLTDEEINTILEKIIAGLEKSGVEIRK